MVPFPPILHCLFHVLQTILTHSRSRVVLQILKEAAEAKKRFKVYVTESMPDKKGYVVCVLNAVMLTVNVFVRLI